MSLKNMYSEEIVPLSTLPHSILKMSMVTKPDSTGTMNLGRKLLGNEIVWAIWS